eukprot:4473880-Prymnesium_polylepis.1
MLAAACSSTVAVLIGHRLQKRASLLRSDRCACARGASKACPTKESPLLSAGVGNVPSVPFA